MEKMMKMMKAAVLDAPFKLEVREVPVPKPGPDEALIKVHCIGICGSDVHYYEHGRIGRYEVKQPLILGHELAGVVVETGERVTNVRAATGSPSSRASPAANARIAKAGATIFARRWRLWPPRRWTGPGPIT
ncbi:hypothetical protein HMSSN036_54670 [Paenibacillus macerans]|nr:hypothetical protein HMSSN036_54670 [Paenibacillus macerans]